MSDRFWPDSKASIILLPSGEQGEALLALAGEWTKMGLLSHALWVKPERVGSADAGPPRIEAVVLGVGRDLEISRVDVDLFEALAREPLTVVRLVKLRSAVPSHEQDLAQDLVAERVRDAVRKSMPMPSPHATLREQPVQLKHAVLICAPTEFALGERVDWASGEYGAVIVAAPEDRSSPWSGDAFVRENERFVGFTLMHLASVAGLWNGVSQGSFELFDREESGHQAIWISRVFVNAVLTESLGRLTAAHVLDEAIRPESLLVDPSISPPPEGTTFIQDALVSGYVDEMVRGAMTVDDGALAFREPPMSPEPPKRRTGIWRQVGRFFVFSGDKLVRMPYWSWRWLTSRTARQLTRALHTDEGAEVVGTDLDEIFDARDLGVLSDAGRLKEDERNARALAHAPASLAHVRTTPRLWARLRELVFGTLDGSADLSDLGFAPIEDKTPIFGRVSDVLALPGEPWAPPRELLPEVFPDSVDWYALALADPREKLEEWVTDAATRRDATQRAVAGLSDQIALLQRRVSVTSPVPWGSQAPDQDGIAEPPPAPPTQPLPPPSPQAQADPPQRPVDPTPATAAWAASSNGSITQPATMTADPASVPLPPPSADTLSPGDQAPPAAVVAEAVDRAGPPEQAAEEPALRSRERPRTPPPPMPAGRRSFTELISEDAAHLAAAHAEREEARAAFVRADTEQVTRGQLLEDFDRWAASQDRSFVWRLLTRLAEERRSAERLSKRLSDEIDAMQIPVPGDLLRLRRRFHRMMLVGWLIVLGIGALLWLGFAAVGRQAERVAAFDPTGWYTALRIVLLLLVLAAVLLTFIALIRYHAGWSRFQRRVDVQRARLAELGVTSRQARQEATRLASLHRQAVDWMVLLSRAIHRPWHVPASWLERQPYDMERRTMPFALQIATVRDDDHAATARLRGVMTDQLVVKGWRHAAFASLVREVGLERGAQAGAFGLEALDEDLPHSSNHTRKMLLAALDDTAVLTRVAGPRLEALVGTAQRSDLHGGRPRVVPVGDNPLRSLLRASDPFDRSGDDIGWDEYLLGTLGRRRDPVTPLSATVLADVDLAERHHERVRSYLVLPQRLASTLEFRPGAEVDVVTFPESGTSPIDLSWRVDIAGPVPQSALRLMSVRGDAGTAPAADGGSPEADTGV
ncbi:hypothetical protein ACFM35_09085 [Microbacterium sp. P01]|uniref:hypothetical protein n=1 Tax=Microbacterium sp. P01 TaxID=3366261 RepID=UPI00366DDCDC